MPDKFQQSITVDYSPSSTGREEKGSVAALRTYDGTNENDIRSTRQKYRERTFPRKTRSTGPIQDLPLFLFHKSGKGNAR